MPSQSPPVLLIIYRRPDTTRKVFEAIRKARPAKLFVYQDAVRPDHPEYVGPHKEAREIATAVDWPCELKTYFAVEHQGIIGGFKAAFDWFFENVEAGMMLEDDEVPDQTYFRFCAEMLEKYRDDERIMSISGSNVLQHYRKPYQEYSYYFLSIPTVWGMATWRRAWKHYDPDVRDWLRVRDSKLLYKLLPSKSAAFYFSKKFQGYYEHKIKSWDGQWVFACLANKGLSIYATKNLLSNIGFNDVNAFHGALKDDLWGDLPAEPISFPLKHPPVVEVNKTWDEYGVRVRYARVDFSWYQKLKSSLKTSFPNAYLTLKKLYYRTLRPKQYATNNHEAERLLLP